MDKLMNRAQGCIDAMGPDWKLKRPSRALMVDVIAGLLDRAKALEEATEGWSIEDGAISTSGRFLLGQIRRPNLTNYLKERES